jgi:hypothetical protein
MTVVRVWAKSSARGSCIAAGEDAFGGAGKGADRVEIVDRMDRDLDPLHRDEEGEQRPGGEDVEMHLDLEQIARRRFLDHLAGGHHHRRKAQLEVDRRFQALVAADPRGSRAVTWSGPIGFWIRTAAPSGRSGRMAVSAPGGTAMS